MYLIDGCYRGGVLAFLSLKNGRQMGVIEGGGGGGVKKGGCYRGGGSGSKNGRKRRQTLRWVL